MSQRTEVKVPDIGDFEGVEVIEILVSPGDTLAPEDPMITLETDKAAMDVPSPVAGKIVEMTVKAGDRVSEGDVIAVLETEAAETPDEKAADAGGDTSSDAKEDKAAEAPAKEATAAPAPPAPETPAKAAPATSLPAIDEKSFFVGACRSVRSKVCTRTRVDLGRVKGSGHKNRITEEDIKAWVKATLSGGDAGGAALPKVPAVDFTKFGEVEVKVLSRIQKISGPRLHAAWVNLPHVFQFDEADITDLEARRQSLKSEAAQRGVKVTPLAFILRACVLALREFPVFNSSLDATGENLVFKKYCHLGFAADTPNGLVVPVIRDADRMDVFELASHLGELSAKARDGKLKAAEMQGGSFTVSSLGGIGGTGFTPIINAPEVAIMGVSRSSYKPVYTDGEFVPRLMLPFSVSYDHRVIDGAAAVRFTSFLAAQLNDVDKLLEAVP